MNPRASKKLNIDTRTAADIEDEILRLADSYETGWHPDLEHPDIGTAIARIFAGQMEENIGRVNDILECYQTEFVNMLDISLLPAKPSSGIVVMQLVADTIEGTGVPKGTKFLSDGEEACVFETDHSIYVSAAQLVNVFQTDGEEHTLVPLLGDYEVPQIAGRMTEEDEQGFSVEGSRLESFSRIRPFRLFGEEHGIGEDAVLIYHPYLFDVQSETIFVRFRDNRSLAADICKGRYSFLWLSEEGLREMQDCRLLEDGETFALKKEGTSKKVSVDGQSFGLLVLRTNDRVEKVEEVSSFTFSAEGEPAVPESVTGMGVDLPCEAFAPFSDTIALYGECYIGLDRYLSKAGATIRLSFDLHFEENRIGLSKEEQEEDLRIIKPRPRAVRDEVFVDSYVDEVTFEYFNGVGWRRLPVDAANAGLFATVQSQKIDLTFVCPGDWQPDISGAYEGRSIRIQILKADNCYLRPCTHHYPVMSQVRLSYSYEGRFLFPSRLAVMAGLERTMLTGEAQGRLVLFHPGTYKEDALYLGFSRRIASGPASLLFELDDEVRYLGLDIAFEYSAEEGFRQMKVLDYTQGFTHSGVVAFVPPSDWAARELSGAKRFWLRLVRTRKESPGEDKGLLPLIKAIYLNAVTVSNVETNPVQEVYIEEVMPGMRFSLGTTGVLDADVWVNEIGRYSQEKMNSMAEASPQDVSIEKDSLGTITAFYVRWKETQRFETAEDKRVYQIDRLTNELIFGDGIHTWIPRVIDDVAVRFAVRCCNGAAGNVPAGAISDTQNYLMYIGSVTNPVKSFGGSDIESIENAMKRGASLLGSRGRLVTTADFERAILAYSDTIESCAGIVGELSDGRRDDAAVSFVLLMKEYEEGSYAFHRVVGGLKEHLLERCELTVVPEKLHLIEPIFVSISVSVWVNVVNLDDSFEIQGLLSDCLREYLSPISSGGGHTRRIGTIPKKPQILMRLGVLKSRAIVRLSAMSARYRDRYGDHEVDLEELVVTPFMVCCSGEHQVHIL